MKNDTFANRLKKAMEINKFKQIDLVNKTKIDKTLINKYLKGISEAKQDNLTLLANALGVNEVWLMGYDVDMKEKTHVLSDDEYIIIPNDAPILPNTKIKVKDMIQLFTDFKNLENELINDKKLMENYKEKLKRNNRLSENEEKKYNEILNKKYPKTTDIISKYKNKEYNDNGNDNVWYQKENGKWYMKSEENNNEN